MSAWCGPAVARRARGFAILRLPEDSYVNAMRYAIETSRWPREIDGDCAPVRNDDPNPAIERDSEGRIVPGQYYTSRADAMRESAKRPFDPYITHQDFCVIPLSD